MKSIAALALLSIATIAVAETQEICDELRDSKWSLDADIRALAEKACIKDHRCYFKGLNALALTSVKIRSITKKCNDNDLGDLCFKLAEERSEHVKSLIPARNEKEEDLLDDIDQLVQQKLTSIEKSFC